MIVQVPGVVPRIAAGITPVLMLIVVAPGAATTLPPGQVVLAAGEAATLKPLPIVLKLSVNEVIAAFVPNSLLKVKVSVEMPPGASVLGEKVLLETLTVGGVVVNAALVAG